jgi:hypothetical protein
MEEIRNSHKVVAGRRYNIRLLERIWPTWKGIIKMDLKRM